MVQPNTLAWHETLELHELIAFQSNVLTKLKMNYKKVTDPDLRSLYNFSIKALENNLKELIQFLPAAPGFSDSHSRADESAFFAGDLLGAAKTSVRNYSIAITETATPALRSVLSKQLMAAVNWHSMVFNYMYSRGYYPSYNLNQLLMNDLRNAQKAIQRDY